MLSSDQIVSVKIATLTRRVPDNETATALFVSFVNPATASTDAVELRVNVWENQENVYDYGSWKYTSSNLVVNAALVQSKGETEGSTTWSLYLLKKNYYKNESQNYTNTDISYELYKLDVNLDSLSTGANSYYWPNWVTNSKTLAIYENIFNADLNGDGKIGPVFASKQPDPSDSYGLKFIRDTEDAVYIYDENGNHKYIRVSEYKSSYTGGGYERTVIAVEKGDPYSFIAQSIFDQAISSGKNRAAAYELAVKEATKAAFMLNQYWNYIYIKTVDENGVTNYKWTTEADYFELGFRARNAGVLDGSKDKFASYKPIESITKTLNATTNAVDESYTYSSDDWSDSVFVVYREGSYYMQGDKKVFSTDQRFSIERLNKDLSGTNNYWYDTSVSWFEKYFGQDLNGDGQTKDAGNQLTVIKPWGEKQVDANVKSAYWVAKDNDGRYYLLDKENPDQANIYRINDVWFAKLNQNTGDRVSGNSVVTLFDWQDSKDPNSILNTYIVTKNFDKTSDNETIYSYTIRALRFNKTDGGKVYSIDFADYNYYDYSWDKSKFFEAEKNFGLDLNGDGAIGKGDPVVVSWVNDLIPQNASSSTNSKIRPDAVIATNAAGEIYILEKSTSDTDEKQSFKLPDGSEQNYVIKPVTDSSNNPAKLINNSSWEKKYAYAVVKTSIQSIKDKVGANTWFPWGNANGTSTAYFVAVKSITNGTNVSWQIYLVNDKGVYDNNYLYINRASQIESVFAQDLNGDGQIGMPIPVEVEGASKTNEFKSNDAVLAAVDSEGRVFIKDTDLSDKDFLPVLNQWGGDSPQWIRKDSWFNYDGGKQFKVERKYELIGAAKSVSDNGQRSYLIAVRESESSDNKDYIGSTRWHVYKVTAKTPIHIQAAYKAFDAALEANKSNESAFDDAAAAAKAILLKDGVDETLINTKIQEAKTKYTNEITNNGLTAKEAFDKQFANADSTSNGNSYGYPGYQTVELPKNALVYSWNEENLKSITEKEELFKQDLNNDGYIGLDINSLKLMSSDIAGTRLAREPGGGLYIVEVDQSNKINSFKSVSGNDWLESSWYGGADNYSKREAFAIAEIRDGQTITGYKLLIKNEYKWYGLKTAQITWDIYRLDKDGKVTWGYWDSTKNQWVNDSEWGITSIKSYENDFGQDLDGDGKKGITVEDLTFEDRDTNGARLARDNVKALYIVLNNKDFIALKNASWLEYSYKWDWGGSDYKKAIAVQAVDENDLTKGYWLALERKSQWGNNAATVYYDILKLDKDGRITWGYWDSKNNKWVDESQYNINSLTAYEKTFNEDFNGDNFIGINPEKLDLDSRDMTGVKLGRDKEKAIYIVFLDKANKAIDAIDIKGTNWLEYDSGWGYKREAVAVEKAEDGGYWLALKTTSSYWDYQSNSNKPQITWDIYKLDSTGRIVNGQYLNGQWVDETVYGTKSISAYEDLFKQDLNGDGKTGIDISMLEVADSDNYGVRLARSTDGGLYFIDQYGQVDQKIKPIKDGWLEYDYSSGDWVSRRKAIAIEKDGDDYILAVKNSYTLYNYDQLDGKYKYEVKNSWDVIRISATGKTLYGYWDSKTNSWIQQSEWGASIASYEPIFGQDLNGDGIKGIDVSKLTPASTDHSEKSGVRLFRDNEKMLYIVNNNQALPIKNSSWMEYSYAWGDWSNTRTAIAAEQSRLDDKGLPIYKVLFRYESKWSGGSDSSWEVMTVDSTGRQIWMEGASVWTRNTKIVEIMLNEDLNGDKNIGANPNDLIDITSDTANPLLRMDKTDDTLYIVDDVKVIPVIDRYGSPVDLNRDVDWGGGLVVKYRPYAVSKIIDNNQFIGYRLLIKVEKTGSNVPNWEIYTISKDGAIDLFNIKTTKDISRYEIEFDQDLDGDKKIGSGDVTLSYEIADKGNATLGRQLKGTEVVALYVLADKKKILLTNKNGGFPAIENNSNGVSASIVATDVNAQGTVIKAALKKVTTDDSGSKIDWEVYHFDIAANSDVPTAVMDRTKTLYLSNSKVKAVEELVNQNLEPDDTTNSVGYGAPDPQSVTVEIGKTMSKDIGDIQAGIDANSGWLYIMDTNAKTKLAVKTNVGLNVSLENSSSYKETIKGFDTTVSVVDKVFAATGVYSSSSPAELSSYLVLVRSKTSMTWTENSEAKSSESVRWKLFTVDRNGTVDMTYMESAQPNRWAALFNQDLDGSGTASGDAEVQSFGVVLSDPVVLRQFKELRHLDNNDFYIKDSLSADEKYIPILLENQSAIDFEFTTSLGDGQLTSEIKNVAKSESLSNEFFLAVDRTYSEGAKTNHSYLIYTLDIKDDPLTKGRYAEVQSDNTYITDDLSTFKDGGKVVFANENVA